MSDRFLATYRVGEPRPDPETLRPAANENVVQPDLNEPARALVEGQGGETESAITLTSTAGGSARSVVTGTDASGNAPPEGRSATDSTVEGQGT